MLTSESHLWTGGYPQQGCGTLGLDVPMQKPDPDNSDFPSMGQSKLYHVLAAQPRFPVRVRCPKCGGLAWADADQVADGVALLLCCGERMVEVSDA